MEGLRFGLTRPWKIAGAIIILIGIVGGSLVAQLPQASAESNQQLAQSLINQCGFGSKESGVGLWSKGTQWTDLVKLWDRESGWQSTAENPGQGHAYGIPQALGHGPGGAEYPNSIYTCGKWQNTRAANPSWYDGSSNAKAQILWGLLYIRNSYYDPSRAWAHSQATGWY